MNIEQKCKELFDENFKCIATNQNELITFCNSVTEKTKIQICTPKGQMYEYLPKVCRSAVKLG